MDEVRVDGKVATVSRNGRTIRLTASRDIAWERTERPDGRAFSPQTGFLAAYLTVDVVPGEATEVSVAVK